jgi:hypothetical protein
VLPCTINSAVKAVFLLEQRPEVRRQRTEKDVKPILTDMCGKIVIF